MKKKKKDILTKKKKIILIDEDGQSSKLEEKSIDYNKNENSLFDKDVNDPSERGWD